MVEVVVVLFFVIVILAGWARWTIESLRLERVRTRSAEEAIGILRRASERRADELQQLQRDVQTALRDRDAAVDYAQRLPEHLRARRIVWLTAIELRHLERRAARVEEVERQAAAHRRALERIADGWARPARLAIETLEEVRARKEQATWATN